jgi:hypothetical protein
VAAIATAVACWAVYAAFVLTEAGQRVENLALSGAELRGASDRGESLGQLSTISLVSFVLAIVAVFGVAFLRQRLTLGFIVVATMGVSTLVAELLQGLLPRPELVSGPAWILRNSFPSGHAAIAAAIGVGVLLVAPDRLRWLALLLGAAFAAVIGQATQITGWHRMSDAIGGVLLVMAIASTSLFGLALAGLVGVSTHGRVHRGIQALVLTAAALATATSAVMIVLPRLFPLLEVPEGAGGAFVHTAFDLLGVGATLMAFVVFAKVIEPASLGAPPLAASPDGQAH